MRRIILVFAVMVSLLMLASAAETAAKDSDKGTFGQVKDTLMQFIGPFLKSGILENFKLSSVFGLFNQGIELMKSHEENIEELHEKCVKDHGQIDIIRVWAQAASEKATQSNELTHKIQFIATKAETGKKEIKEIEKQQKVVEETKKEADIAIQDFDSKQVALLQMVVKALTEGTFPSTGSLIGLVTGGAHIATGMYSSFKKVNQASTTTHEALQAASRALKNVKQYLKESQEIQKSLQNSELREASKRIILGPNGTIISDVSSGFSLLQNMFFLTLVAAFLIADKPVW